MAQSETSACAICAGTGDLTGVVVGGRQLHLCRRHAAKLGDDAPASFDDLAALFASAGADRRRSVDRRNGDRRMFPPRPELRRRNFGRRDDDPSG